ncbi:DNA helicase [Nocardia yunnanensis]|uniref:DNA helicase n=1 Tax=Nocardia yunnanensis TaxID=2382165 RepID=A0A386ZD38_9NOCA|nr:ATP-binding protein [Nocardia yunnanensis]AYF75500.1 DNA helicase [Nocardia yunnanensis]
MGGTERARQLLRFWRAIEMFSPQEIPKVATRGSGPFVVDVGVAGPAPWEAEHPLWREHPLPPGKTWRFTVYGGLFQIERVRDELLRAFGPEQAQPDARPIGTTAMFAFILDQHGTLVEDSPKLSACAWAVGRLQTPGPGDKSWLNGFDKDEQELVSGLNELASPGFAEAVSKRFALMKATGSQGKTAGREALAKGLGTATTAAAAAAVASVAGPVAGGMVGATAGTFVEKMVAKSAAAKSKDGDKASGPATFTFTAENLHQFTSDLSDALGISKALDAGGVRVKCVQVSEKRATDVDADFLNSFIAQDLADVEKAVADRDIGLALHLYLSDDCDSARRVDVRANPSAIVAGLSPSLIPPGRWPGDTRRPLVLSQQFAVNQLMAELSEAAGIFAVNGPPGTGKTTMLRDALAAIVVERALRLAEYDSPTSAFTRFLGKVQVDRYQFKVHAPNPDITGFEVVLATASNDAAANVTAEIPAVAAVQGVLNEALAAGYFPELATHILEGDAWGLIAAVLGNMKNRSEFSQRFWWGKEGIAQDRSEADDAPDPADDGVVGMQKILAQADGNPEEAEAWRSTRAAFRSALAEVRQLASERQAVADDIAEFNRLRTVVEDVYRDIEIAQQEHDRRKTEHAAAEAERQSADAELQSARAAVEEHNRDKPGFWISLSTLFRAGREWNDEAKVLIAARKSADLRYTECAEAVTRAAGAWAAAAAEGQRLIGVHSAAVRDLEAVGTRADRACERWPGTVPFGSVLDDERRFQLCNAWADEEFTQARHRLFLEALRLHRAFALAAASRLRGNLAVLSALLRGPLDPKPSTEVLTAVWQSLFLLVPMVSTTFASLPRLFAGLGRETFGWLFIDEAGQATPQQAVGGLWRARRAVIVGDPQQLEPIVTLPLPAQRALLEHYRVPEQWTPDFTSTQRVADRLARYGTNLPDPQGGESAWVGAPLRVHRRCDRPMFAISNAIAYGGDLMVYGTPARGEFPGENAWFDIRSGVSEGNWVPAEGDRLAELLDWLVDGIGLPPNSIRVISPFRDVVRGSKVIAARTIDGDFARGNVGTVHTVQGQESDVVILVLGTPAERAGARRWAASTPNLLNVAVSRAKRRLYVIGNHESWSEQRFFNVLAATLPRTSDGR